MEKFSTSFTGYKKEEVNAFVADVIKQVESMIGDMKAKDVEIEQLKQSLEKYKNMEQTFNKALLMAEDTSNQIRRLARDESATIIADARKNASRIVNDGLLRAEKIEIRSDTLERNMRIFKRKLKLVVEQQLAVIDEIEELKLK